MFYAFSLHFHTKTHFTLVSLQVINYICKQIENIKMNFNLSNIIISISLLLGIIILQ